MPLFALLILLAVAGAAPLVRGPYLQQTTPTGTLVVWSTLYADSQGEVRYGPDPARLDHSVVVPGGTHHEARITGLAPGSTTFYAVYSDGALVASGPEQYVRTPPPVGTPAPVRMWVLGDSGTGLPAQYAVRDAMRARVGRDEPDLVLHLGDLAYTHGWSAQLTANFFWPYRRLLAHAPVWPTLGNHEGRSADSATQSGPYYDAFVLPTAGEAGGVPSGTEAYYSFDHANAHVIVLDSHDSDRSPDGPMAGWLRADLAATDAQWVIATWHHAPYSKGSHDSDTHEQLVEMREHLLPILEAGGVDLVLAGHSHIYERSHLLHGAYDTPSTTAGILDAGDGTPGGDGPYAKHPGEEGTLYVVAGHGGSQVEGAGGHPLMAVTDLDRGSVLLDLHGNRLDLVNVRSDGAVTDRVALVQGEALVLVEPNGGKRLAPGSVVPIRWDTVGDTARVEVAWTPDDGATWHPIAEVPDHGQVAWTVPDHPTADVRVRVVDADDPAVRDQSNGRLSIGAPRE